MAKHSNSILQPHTLSEDDFLQWASANGMVLSPRYPHAKNLVFTADSERRFWCVPPEPLRRPYFLSSFFELMENWNACYVWRHLGKWPDEAPHPNLHMCHLVERCILRGLGLPLGTGDIVRFERSELDQLLAILFTMTLLACTTADDLIVVPDHARQILMTDHHDVVHVSFRNAADVQDWISKMAARKFHLPDELPDETFKRPAWMAEKPNVPGRDGSLP